MQDGIGKLGKKFSFVYDYLFLFVYTQSYLEGLTADLFFS